MDPQTGSKLKIEAEISAEKAARILERFPEARGSLSIALEMAMESAVDSSPHFVIPDEMVKEITALAQVPRIKTGEDLMAAFRKMGKLNESQVVVTIDPALTPMLYQVAQSTKLTLAEVASNYFTHGINAGWFNNFLENFYVNFDLKQYTRLKELVGVKGRPSGADVLALIVSLRENLDQAQALASASELPIPGEAANAPV